MKDDKLYRLSEAAAILGVKHVTVWRWCNDGKIAHVTMPSGQRRIPASEIERILKVEQPTAQTEA